MNIRIECEQEVDGGSIAEAIGLPGALTYGNSRRAAMTHAEALAFRILAERLDTGESGAVPVTVVLAAS